MEGIVKIEGLIGIVGDEIGVQLTDVVDQVRSQKSATSFKVIITSEGGDVETGEDIYAYLKALKIPVHTVGVGLVASIATVIFMAGDTRSVLGHPEFMIHLPMGNPGWLTADEMLDYSKHVKETETKMVKFYSEHTGMESEAIWPMLRNETTLTPEQLLSFGFITEQVPYKIAARASLNINQKQNKMSKESESLLQAIFDVVVGKKASGKKKKDIVNLTLLTAKQTEVDFYELEDDAEVVLGAKARIDDVDAEGEVVMADGRTFVFVAGALDQILEAENEMELEEALEALATAEAQLALHATEKETLTAQLASVKVELDEKTKVVDKIQALRSKYEDTGGKSTKEGGKQASKKDSKANRFGKAMSNIKNQK